MVYSIRMRSAKGGPHELGGLHISGAERLSEEIDLASNIESMVKRALYHTKGKADFIRLTIEEILQEKIKYVNLLPIKNYTGDHVSDGRQKAKELLISAGVNVKAIEIGIKSLDELKDNMRGAMILSSKTGNRLDCLGNRGIRVSRMDSVNEANLKKWLEKQNYTGIHIREAIILASKVVFHSDVVAELCWSDDPEYTTGYVATKEYYNRIVPLKDYGSQKGGRIFFVKDDTNIKNLQEYLEKQPVFISKKDGCNGLF